MAYKAPQYTMYYFRVSGRVICLVFHHNNAHLLQETGAKDEPNVSLCIFTSRGRHGDS